MEGTRKADVVAKDLLTQVVSGVLAVGDILPREADLAERYGVNRSVVREAIKLLEVHRLVRPVRRRGTEVLDPVASMSPEVLIEMLRPGGAVYDQSMLADLLEVRAALDVLMAGLAAEHRTDDDLLALDTLVDELERTIDDAPAYARLQNDVALALARASKNRLLEMLVHWNATVYGAHEDLFRTVRLALPPHLQGVRALVQLVREQDAENAKSLVAAFHDWATPRLLAASLLASGLLPTADQDRKETTP